MPCWLLSERPCAEGLEDAILVDVDSIHHDVLELPAGDFAVLASEVRTVENYATSDEDPDASRATQDVVGDIVVEFARDGTLVNQWHLLDLVDPYRVGYGSLDKGFWRTTYQALMDDEPDVADWAHANALFYDRAQDAYLVALRHQDAIVKLDRATGQERTDYRWRTRHPARERHGRPAGSPVGAHSRGDADLTRRDRVRAGDRR